MKKIIISIISIAVVISLLAVAVFAFTSLGQVDADDNATLKPSTYEILSQIAETEDNTFTVSKYNQREIFSDVSAENLEQIFMALEIVISKNETIEFSNDYFFEYVFMGCYEMVEEVPLYTENQYGRPVDVVGGGKYIVSTDVDHSLLKYAMLAKIYLENFPDAVSFSISSYDLTAVNNNVTRQCINIFFDYEEYGYKNAEEFSKKLFLNNETEVPDGVYTMSCMDIDVFSTSDYIIDTKTPNILEKYNPVPKRIQTILEREARAEAKANAEN